MWRKGKDFKVKKLPDINKMFMDAPEKPGLSPA